MAHRNATDDGCTGERIPTRKALPKTPQTGNDTAPRCDTTKGERMCRALLTCLTGPQTVHDVTKQKACACLKRRYNGNDETGKAILRTPQVQSFQVKRALWTAPLNGEYW